MKNLLVAIDFSDVTERVVSAAEELARAFGAKVWLLHVVAEVSAMASLGEVPFHWPAAEAELPRLARKLDCDASEVRVVEVQS